MLILPPAISAPFLRHYAAFRGFCPHWRINVRLDFGLVTTRGCYGAYESCLCWGYKAQSSNATLVFMNKAACSFVVFSLVLGYGLSANFNQRKRAI
eukprot:6183869-Pleurochrysis_carterae.AAC.5